MRSKGFEYYADYVIKTFPDQQQLITYSFNDKENTIKGVLVEKKDIIFLYEFRGEYIGNEFFISFSKGSASYRIIKVEDLS